MHRNRPADEAPACARADLSQRLSAIESDIVATFNRPAKESLSSLLSPNFGNKDINPSDLCGSFSKIFLDFYRSCPDLSRRLLKDYSGPKYGWGLFVHSAKGISFSPLAFVFFVTLFAMGILGLWSTFLVFFAISAGLLFVFRKRLALYNAAIELAHSGDIHLSIGHIGQKSDDIFLVRVCNHANTSNHSLRIPKSSFQFTQRKYHGISSRGPASPSDRVFLFSRYDENLKEMCHLGFLHCNLEGDYHFQCFSRGGYVESNGVASGPRAASRQDGAWFVNKYANITKSAGTNIRRFSEIMYDLVSEDLWIRRDEISFALQITKCTPPVKLVEVPPKPVHDDSNDMNDNGFQSQELNLGIGEKASARLSEAIRSKHSDSPFVVLVHGSSGNGKTHLRSLLKPTPKLINAAEISPELVNREFAESLVKLRHSESSAFYFDDADRWFSSQGETTKMVDYILSFIDSVSDSKMHLFFVAPKVSDFPERLRERASLMLELNNPDIRQFNILTKHYFPKWDASDQSKVPGLMRGLSVRQVLNISKSTISQTGIAALEKQVSAFRKSRGVPIAPDSGWKDLVLPEQQVSDLKKVSTLLKRPNELRAEGITIPRSLLLIGPPGTGKTKIARTFANQSGMNFIAAKTSDIKADVIGRSPKAVAALFARARSQTPCILFFDEIDGIVPSRTSGKSDAYTREISIQMLQEMDGVHADEADLFILAATNVPEIIDSGIISRFRRKMYIDLPDRQCRANMFFNSLSKFFLVKLGRNELSRFAFRLSDMSEGLSGRDIYGLAGDWIEEAAAEHLEKGGNASSLRETLVPDAFLNFLQKSML